MGFFSTLDDGFLENIKLAMSLKIHDGLCQLMGDLALMFLLQSINQLTICISTTDDCNIIENSFPRP